MKISKYILPLVPINLKKEAICSCGRHYEFSNYWI